MTESEKLNDLMNRISFALKDDTLAQGFEIICKRISELEKEIDCYKSLESHYEEIEEDAKAIAEENESLKKSLARYSEKIAEQEEQIDAQDDKINFYVAKMNEHILKSKELQKENEELKTVCDYNCPDHKFATHNACLMCPAVRNSPHHDLKNVSDEELQKIIKEAEEEMD